MKTGEGCQESFNIGLEEANVWWNKHTAGCSRCSGRYRPVKKTTKPAELKADLRYYKLHNGDILDVETKTILSRDALLDILR